MSEVPNKEEAKGAKVRKRPVPFYREKNHQYEAVIVDGVPYFLYYDADKGFQVKEDISFKNVKLSPIGRRSIPYKPYTFDRIPKSRSYTEIYRDIYSEFDTFAATASVYKHLFTTFTNLSYKQLPFDCLPYIFLIGLSDSGKTTVLRLIAKLGYRPLYGTSFPSADIYTYLGQGEGGDSLILEDEIQGLEKDREKLKIYKSGNLKGAKVPRILKDTRTILYYNTFGLKGFAGEEGVKDKGFMRRCIVPKMVKGTPKRKLTKATEEDEKRFNRLRNDLLLWKLAGGVNTDPLVLPETGLNDLWEPVLYFARGTLGYQLLTRKFARESIRALESEQTTLEGYLAKSLKETISALNPVGEKVWVPFEDVWVKLMAEVEGVSTPSKPYSIYSDDVGEVSKHKIGRILKGIFGGVVKTKTYKGGISKKVYLFDKSFLESVFERYYRITDITDLLREGGLITEEKPPTPKEEPPTLQYNSKISKSVTKPKNLSKIFEEEL